MVGVTLEATLRPGPALMDSVERRAISLPGLVGTKSVFANFFRGRQFLSWAAFRARRRTLAPNSTAAGPL
jgi:hypothetical protein